MHSETANGPVVSIIVPVYNTSPALLERCVNSILAQTCGDFELIIADDGSTADTVRAVDAQASRDPRIRVLHLPHAGVSAARNAGIEVAAGEWIAFADADDEVLPCFLDEALAIAKETGSDYVGGSLEDVFADGIARRRRVFLSALSEKRANYVILSDTAGLQAFRAQMLAFADASDEGIPSTPSRGPVSKLYRRSLIGGLRFDARIAQGEDALFNFDYLGRCGRVAQSDGVWYRYWQYAGSGTHGANMKQRLEGLAAVCALPSDERFGSAFAAFECHLAVEGTEAVLRSSGGGQLQGIREAASALREMSQVGGCFECLDLSEFKVPLRTRIIYRLCARRLYRTAALVLWLKALVKRLLGKGAFIDA